MKPVWEYKVLVLQGGPDSDQKELNRCGADSWELVSVFYSGSTFAYLKRFKDLPEKGYRE